MTRHDRRGLARRIGRAGAGILALIIIAGGLGPVHAQTAPPALAAPPAVPTTKILAIGSFTAGTSPKEWLPVLPAEVRETVRLYLAGRIDQWYVKQDQSGVVFVMNITDPQEARVVLERLPFGQAGMMRFAFIPLGPIGPLALLLPDRP